MFLDYPEDWIDFFKSYYSDAQLNKLSATVEALYREQMCYPPSQYIFNAFNQCNLESLKVVLIGQDPYHGPLQAHGLSFSVPLGVPHPPSLKNILIELSDDLDVAYPISGDLSKWAGQGVLLLNASLSVVSGKAGSHMKYWNSFTKAIIEGLNRRETPIIFLLWGNFAHQYEPYINAKQHKVLKAGHPSPLSANRGYWFGNKHFSKVNELLKNYGQTPIDWEL